MPYIPKETKRYWVPEARKSSWTRSKKNHSFYTGSAWKGARNRKLNQNPMCEVNEYRDQLIEATVVDHIIPIEFGGSKYDPENLMSLVANIHNKKSRKEQSRDAPLVKAKQGASGLVPVNREDVFKVLLNSAYHKD